MFQPAVQKPRRDTAAGARSLSASPRGVRRKCTKGASRIIMQHPRAEKEAKFELDHDAAARRAASGAKLLRRVRRDYAKNCTRQSRVLLVALFRAQTS